MQMPMLPTVPAALPKQMPKHGDKKTAIHAKLQDLLMAGGTK